MRPSIVLVSLLLFLCLLDACNSGGETPAGARIEAPQAAEDVVTVAASPGDRILLRSSRIPLHPDFVDATTAPEFDAALLKLHGDVTDPKSFGSKVRVFEFEVLADRPTDVRIVTRCAKSPTDRVARYRIE